ncbi:methyl-accepting chemotaxis protein [Bdellovibrio sp. ArHS]|uniref:methyl-accepting chemotaxis protein n=1 Tax=Bdellovibrio sp. ArHS TaxID=1569284 RepID=UPI000B15E085|nr:methyl-accepting chemotaxis protein [Bdellovibrio sp. ArHS]
MFEKLNLKTKLLLLCALLLSVTIAVGSTAFISLKNVGHEYDFIVNKVSPKAGYASRMLANYRKLRVNLTTLGVAGISAKDGEAGIRIAREAIADYEKDNKEYVDLKFIPGQKEFYDKVDVAWNDFKKTSDTIISFYQSGTPEDKEKMQKAILSECAEKALVYTAAINDLLKFHESNMNNRAATAREITSNANTFTLSFIIGGVIFALLFGYFFANSLARSLQRISESVLLAAEQTSTGGAQLAAASVQLSSGSTEAAASLEETVASIEELSSMVKMNTAHAQEANGLSQKSREAAEKGEVEISKLISSMSDIASGSKKIEEIINVIDDIAFQTNLLALNAAVEAARAGEQGKGFAVVAEAVRSLAQRSAVAAKDISSLITENVSKSENGAKIASESGVVLKEILLAVKKVADLNGEIATGSQEQANGLEQITKAMNQLDQATQGNAASSEEVAASSEEMSQQANALSELVDELQKIVQGAKSKGKVVASAAFTPSHKKITKTTAKSETAASIIPFASDENPGRKVSDVSGF